MRDKNLSDQMQKGINPINNQSVDKSFAKEVQATLPLTFYIYIFDEIDSRYHKYFRTVLLSVPPQVCIPNLT